LNQARDRHNSSLKKSTDVAVEINLLLDGICPDREAERNGYKSLRSKPSDTSFPS